MPKHQENSREEENTGQVEVKPRRWTEEELRNFKLRDNQYRIRMSGSGGPGGQSVNTSKSKATAFVTLRELGLAPEEIEAIRRLHPGNINEKGELFASEQAQKSPQQNVKNVLEKLEAWIVEALTPEKPRIATTPPPVAEAKRLKIKHRRGEKKDFRRKVRPGDRE